MPKRPVIAFPVRPSTYSIRNLGHRSLGGEAVPKTDVNAEEQDIQDAIDLWQSNTVNHLMGIAHSTTEIAPDLERLLANYNQLSWDKRPLNMAEHYGLMTRGHEALGQGMKSLVNRLVLNTGMSEDQVVTSELFLQCRWYVAMNQDIAGTELFGSPVLPNAMGIDPNIFRNSPAFRFSSTNSLMVLSNSGQYWTSSTVTGRSSRSARGSQRACSPSNSPHFLFRPHLQPVPRIHVLFPAQPARGRGQDGQHSPPHSLGTCAVTLFAHGSTSQ